MKSGAEWVNLVALFALAGWLGAFLTQALKRVKWASWVKAVLAVIVAAVVGLATVWQGGVLSDFIKNWGNWTAQDVIAVVVLTYTSAQVWYVKFFKDAEWAVKLGEWPKTE